LAELERIVAVLREDPTCQRAILYGSLVSGDVHEWSDIDLVVIQESDMRFWDRVKAMLLRVEPRLATDILVYTPKEYQNLVRDRPFVRDEIAERGRVVYERQ